MIKVKLTTDRPLPPEAQKWLDDTADKITADLNEINFSDIARIVWGTPDPVVKSQIAQSINRILEDES